jgi:hypothetical protein
VPAIVAENEATSPGSVAPAGTVQTCEYVPADPGVAVIVADDPAHITGELTVAVGSGLTIILPLAVTVPHPPLRVTI